MDIEDTRPEMDGLSLMLVESFTMIERGRRYAIGMSGASPMRLSLCEINPYLERFEPPLPDREFVMAIFRMDNAILGSDE